MIQALGRRMRHLYEDITDRFHYGADAPAPGKPRRWPGLLWRAALVLFVFCLFYYPIGMILATRIDDNLNFDVPSSELRPGQSHAVALAAALIRRETNTHTWVANDPFFLPGAALDRMPSFQLGIVEALGRFAFEMTDQIGRTRGSSQADSDLQQAAGLLQYPGTIWVWDPSVSLLPTASSEAQYRKAAQSLDDYNRRLAQGTAVFDPRTDNLLATIDRFAADLGSDSAKLDREIREAGYWSAEATRLAYGVKGHVYAYYLVTRALRDDYQVVIRDRQMQSVFDQAIASLAEAARLHPLFVFNASPGSLFFPNHLAAEGFYVLRARTQLREITSILQK
jgi:hypothetical protein